jgi:hypothetical protein
MSFDSDPSALIPVDQVFQTILARARSLAASRDRLEATDAARVSRELQRANQIAARYEWKPRAAVAMIEEQVCSSCGTVNRIFRGFGLAMRRAADSTERIVSTPGLDGGFPPERYFIHSTSEACLDCLPTRKL